MVLEYTKYLIEKIKKSEKIAKLKEKALQLYAERLQKKVKDGKNTAIQLLAAILIPLMIFFPIDVRDMLLGILIVTFVLFALLVIISLKTVGMVGTTGIKYFMLTIVALLSLLALTQFINCGGMSCFDVVGEKFGIAGAYLIFLMVLAFFILVALLVSGLAFWTITIISAVLMIIFLPLLSPSSWYITCRNIPFVSSSEHCNPIKIKITQAKYISVQTTGGISVDFNAPESMYGGEPYEFSFSIKNLFPTTISFSVTPLLNIKYKTSVLYFLSPFHQGTSTINPNTSYQTSVFIDPSNLKISENIPLLKSKICPYTATDIARHKGYYTTTPFGTVFMTEKVECASDKPCGEKICVASGTFDCECLDFIDLTCSSQSKIFPAVYIKNSGVMRAKLTLFYSDKYTQAVSPLKFSNNDISLTLEAIPNPYIGNVHKYLTDVALFLKIKNVGGGTVKIREIKVMTPKTIINTTDLSKEITLIEEVGTDVIKCESVSNLFPAEIESNEEYGGMFCKLLPPQVKVTLVDHKNNESKSANVTYNAIMEYCLKGSEDERWIEIFEKIRKSGLCEIISNKRKEDESRIINQSISSTYVYVEVKYEKENVYSYRSLKVDTRTRKCIERCVDYCMKEGKKEEECQRDCSP